MMERLGFDEVCRLCLKVVTGERMLDRTTLESKLPYVVAKRARALGKKAIGHFGCRGAGWEKAAGCFDEMMFENEKCLR
jgi:glycerate kinase